jgi:RNA polymerase sigma factor (sigma-70 family)
MSPRLPHPLLAVQSDGRLTELVARGHENAFEALVKRYRAPLQRYCTRMGLSEAQAEDVVQQSFTKAWLALGRGAEIREPRAWLYRVVHNTAVSAMRRPHESGEELTLHAGDDELSLRSNELDGALEARDALGHVAALPQMQRDAVVLAAIQGRSHEEVAGVLGVSDGAVRGLLHRARTTLRSAAAALTPQGLLEWLARGQPSLPAAERTGEMALGGGAIGVAVKGALAAATAGLVVAGGVAVHSSRHHRAAHPAGSAAALADTSGSGSGSVSSTAPVSLRVDASTLRHTGAGSGGGRRAGANHRSATDGSGHRTSSTGERHGRGSDHSENSGGHSGSDAIRGSDGSSDSRSSSGSGGSGGSSGSGGSDDSSVHHRSDGGGGSGSDGSGSGTSGGDRSGSGGSGSGTSSGSGSSGSGSSGSGPVGEAADSHDGSGGDGGSATAGARSGSDGGGTGSSGGGTSRSGEEPAPAPVTTN